MSDVTGFENIPPTALADILGREQVVDIGIRPLWAPVPRCRPGFHRAVPSR
jgi:hypothetical protein